MGNSKAFDLFLFTFKHSIMAKKFTPLLNSEPIITLCNNKNPSYSYIAALNKQSKNRAFIISEAHLSNDASYQGKFISDRSFVFSRETSHKSFCISSLPFLAIQGINFQNHAVVILASTAVIVKLLQNPSFWKRVMNVFKKRNKCVKEKHEETKKTSVWRLRSDDLLVTMDAYKIEYFVYNVCMMLLWCLISRLISFLCRFYSKNHTK